MRHFNAIFHATVVFSLGLLATTIESASADSAEVGPDVITVVVVGDVGLNRSNLPVDPRGVREGKGVLTWEKMTGGIADMINGDINFMNLETVVTDRNNLTPGDKGQKKPYLFRTHPKGVSHLVDVGFNLISAANNHAYDYGEGGVRETVKHLKGLGRDKKSHFAGVGLNRDQATAPASLTLRGARIAFASVGIVTNMIKAHRATDKKPGSMSYRYPEDWQLVTSALADTRADMRLLSIHYGKERQIKSEPKQLTEWRWAAREKRADIVIGHHAHVVRGVELHKGKLIFYGLGNFLIRGARDMGADPRLATWGDYGLYAKVYMVRDKLRDNVHGGYKPMAIEVIPIIDMHRSPRRYPSTKESHRRLEVLNVLATRLDDKSAGSVGVRFSPRKDGSGLHCVLGSAQAPKPVSSLCQGWTAPKAPSRDIARIVSAKLGKKKTSAKRPSKKRRRSKKKRR